MRLPEPVVREVRIGSISIPRGRRRLRDVAELAASIQELGLLNPIILDKKLNLVAGFHRVQACSQLGHTSIFARIVDPDQLHLDLIEIDENLQRFELSELEKARALLARKQIYEIVHPDSRSVRVRGGPGRGHRNKTSDKMAVVLPFTRESARKLGLSPRSVERSLQIAQGLDEKTMELLADCWLADSQSDLLRLARLDIPTRQRVAAQIAAGTAVHIKAALRQVERENLLASTRPSKGNRDWFRVHTGDFAIIAKKHVKPESVDMIVTDPQWDQDASLRYKDLAWVAHYVLKPGGVFVALIGQDHLPGLLGALTPKGSGRVQDTHSRRLRTRFEHRHRIFGQPLATAVKDMDARRGLGVRLGGKVRHREIGEAVTPEIAGGEPDSEVMVAGQGRSWRRTGQERAGRPSSRAAAAQSSWSP
jgi:hypothetical protein